MQLTRKDIETAMKNEAFARCRYELYAEQARAEGLHYFAKILEETAKNELSHFREFMQILGDLKDTKTNLQTAIADEDAEAENLYPALQQDAMADGELNTARLFQQIAKIEARHRTGVCAKHQRLLSTALKRARYLALLPYTVEHVRWSSSGVGESKRSAA